MFLWYHSSWVTYQTDVPMVPLWYHSSWVTYQTDVPMVRVTYQTDVPMVPLFLSNLSNTCSYGTILLE